MYELSSYSKTMFYCFSSFLFGYIDEVFKIGVVSTSKSYFVEILFDASLVLNSWNLDLYKNNNKLLVIDFHI